MSTAKIGEFVSIARDGAIATVTMDRGDGRNALSRQLILEMTDAARSFADATYAPETLAWLADKTLPPPGDIATLVALTGLPPTIWKPKPSSSPAKAPSRRAPTSRTRRWTAAAPPACSNAAT